MLARELISLHDHPREVPPFSERYRELSTQQAYAAARELHQHRVACGWRPVGRKIGFTNRTIWPRYGVYEPIWGTVYDRTLIRANLKLTIEQRLQKLQAMQRFVAEMQRAGRDAGNRK